MTRFSSARPIAVPCHLKAKCLLYVLQCEHMVTVTSSSVLPACHLENNSFKQVLPVITLQTQNKGTEHTVVKSG